MYGIDVVYTHGVTQRLAVAEGLEYANTFANYKGMETVEAVDRLLSGYTELHPFERAQLGSMAFSTAEEAISILPSLETKILLDHQALQGLLDELKDLRETDGNKAL
ncbi:hypothetical protein NKR19_g3714 [Coniochaeta hoffmannii]|uniref:RNA polymerase Rpb4/RPC9 core domain-containing protein n=1 Tax=Coniochaeta hoffmannii TaxID=91930 RepID=A0AA38SG97_9PEZI|nr:hypothetical protein NKR19_g3714 [Coniochaeta hoffmannii]